MKHFLILIVCSILFACGGDSTDGRAANPIDEKADQLHDALDKAHEVEATLEEQKKAIDDALEEAEQVSPD